MEHSSATSRTARRTNLTGLRVAVFAPHARPHDGGGLVYQLELLRAILRSAPTCRHEFVFIAPPGEELASAADRGHDIIELSGLRAGLVRDEAERLMRRLKRQSYVPTRLDVRLRRANIDLVWCLGPSVPSMEFPFFVIVWDLQHRLQPFFPEVSAHGIWDRREAIATILRRAAVVFAGTEAGKSEILALYQVPPERIVVVPIPTPQLDLEDDPLWLAESARLDDGFLLYPAQFWPHKNHVTLLRALERLKRQSSAKPRLVLVGSDNGNLAYVNAVAADLGIADQIHYLGFVSRRELATLYRHAVALVYPTLFGPDNLPPLEAFALGCPVVASRIPGSEDQLGDAAILFDPLDADSLAHAIQVVLESPLTRDRLRARGYARARLWTPDDYVGRVIQQIDRFAMTRSLWGRWASTR